MGIMRRIKRLFSTKPSVSDHAVIWAFDVNADQKPIDEYDLIVMFSDDEDLPIFLQVKRAMNIPEGTLAYQSTDSDWAFEVNDESIVSVKHCKLIPPSQSEDVDRSRLDVVEVPEKITGGNIPASQDTDMDLTGDELRELL